MLARGSSGVEVWSVAVDDGSASVGRGEDGARVAEEERDCGGDIEGVVLVVMGESGGRAVVRARLARRVERNARGKGVLLASLYKREMPLEKRMSIEDVRAPRLICAAFLSTRNMNYRPSAAGCLVESTGLYFSSMRPDSSMRQGTKRNAPAL